MIGTTNALKAIFFDLDNVLVFSEVMHFKAWQQVLSHYGVDPNRIDFHSTIGFSDFVQAQQFTEKFSLAVDATALWEFKRNTFLEMSQSGFEFPLGRNELLEDLSSRFTLAVVSSSGRKIVDQVLKNEKIISYFDFIIGFEDCDKHKPSPTPYLNALVKANVSANEALVIEDSTAGITSAQKAAIPVIGILKDQSAEQIFQDVKYFKTFSEVHQWLQLTSCASIQRSKIQ